MKKLKQMLKPIETRYAPAERFTLRVEEEVEIYEHEAIYVERIPKPSGSPLSALSAPRLTVTEDAHEAEPVLVKTRSEISGLKSLLQALATT